MHFLACHAEKCTIQASVKDLCPSASSILKGEKMSKSRGTFILAKEFLEKVKHPQAPEFLRFYYGSKLMPNTGDIDLNSGELLTG